MSVNKKRIGIIIGTARDDHPDTPFLFKRKSKMVGNWVYEQVSSNKFIEEYKPGYMNTENLDFIILDIAKYWPFATQDVIDKWRNIVESCDAFIVIAAEYSHSFPGALKFALDLFPDKDSKTEKAPLKFKPVGIIGLGWAASGARAVEQLKTVMSALGSWVVSTSVLISLYQDMEEDKMNIREHHKKILSRMLNEIFLLITGPTQN